LRPGARDGLRPGARDAVRPGARDAVRPGARPDATHLAGRSDGARPVREPDLSAMARPETWRGGAPSTRGRRRGRRPHAQRGTLARTATGTPASIPLMLDRSVVRSPGSDVPAPSSIVLSDRAGSRDHATSADPSVAILPFQCRDAVRSNLTGTRPQRTGITRCRLRRGFDQRPSTDLRWMARPKGFPRSTRAPRRADGSG
jgi:hypothetical protein